jgi:hypothetical protein
VVSAASGRQQAAEVGAIAPGTAGITVRPGVTVGRLGGDEFAIVLPAGGHRRAGRHRRRRRGPGRAEDRTADQLLGKADSAMYRLEQDRGRRSTDGRR